MRSDIKNGHNLGTEWAQLKFDQYIINKTSCIFFLEKSGSSYGDFLSYDVAMMISGHKTRAMFYRYNKYCE